MPRGNVDSSHLSVMTMTSVDFMNSLPLSRCPPLAERHLNALGESNRLANDVGLRWAEPPATPSALDMSSPAHSVADEPRLDVIHSHHFMVHGLHLAIRPHGHLSHCLTTTTSPAADGWRGLGAESFKGALPNGAHSRCDRRQFLAPQCPKQGALRHPELGGHGIRTQSLVIAHASGQNHVGRGEGTRPSADGS